MQASFAQANKNSSLSKAAFERLFLRSNQPVTTVNPALIAIKSIAVLTPRLSVTVGLMHRQPAVGPMGHGSGHLAYQAGFFPSKLQK
jgi:hypothetical protein